MANGIERRAQIDAETFKALILLNGGGAVALLAFLPSIIDKSGYERLTAAILFGLILFMLGLVFAVVHNRLRRLCSLEFEQHNMSPPKGQILGFQLQEPTICWVSVRCIYSSLVAFVAAGLTIATGGLMAVREVSFADAGYGGAGRWLATVGLLFDIIGAIFLGLGLFVSRARAVEISLARFSSKVFEENLLQPQVQDRLKQSHFAMFGLPLLVLGFLLQLAAVWLT